MVAKKRKAPMSRNKRLAIALVVVIGLILVVPQGVRYALYASEASSAFKQEKAYIKKVIRQTNQSAAARTPVVEHWDVGPDGKMRISISKQAMTGTNGQVKVWVKAAAARWNKALGAKVVLVNDKTVDQSQNVNENRWPEQANYQVLIGYKQMVGDDGSEDTSVLATTTEAGNMLWISKHAGTVWRSNRIEREDYLSGAIVGPVTTKDITALHDDEATHTITHELGHAFGLKHQGQATDLMSPVVGINDKSIPSASEIRQVKTILYLAAHPEVVQAATTSWPTLFATTYQAVNGQVLPDDLVVINDSHTS
jgi:hypothetical protein